MKSDTRLQLGFQGRIIDHIGIQMYQSPTAALAEIVSNAWDADATKVDISFDFDSDTKSSWSITVSDDGNGMTWDECQDRFLNVGFDRREGEGLAAKSPGGRPLMGRKGIGKFAGFGIARFIGVNTVSKNTGERTEFELDQEVIRKGNTYVSTEELKIDAKHWEPSDDFQYGTTVVLRDLKLAKRISVEMFKTSLARRFLISRISDDFEVNVNGQPISDGLNPSLIEMNFPRDLPNDVKNDLRLKIDEEGWGIQNIAEGKEIRWRVLFFKDLVKDDDLTGISVFAHKKMAQRPFMFDLSGGLPSQTGPEYMSGQVVADWIDEFEDDVISTNRQQIRWDHPEVVEFKEWGQEIIKQLLSIWKNNRSEKRIKILESKVDGFSDRLDKLGSSGKPVRAALMKLADIDTLSLKQFHEMGSAILLAWERGMLKDLIEEISRADDMDEAKLVKVLAEANTITALHTAEIINTKLAAINGLESRVKRKDLENSVRDYIAKNPWLISPEWETFAAEERLSSTCMKAGETALKDDVDLKRRADLILSSGRQLLILEFMRPGLTINRDHINKLSHYFDIIREHIKNPGVKFDMLSGYIIADNISNITGMEPALERLDSHRIHVMDWATLIENSKHQWKEFLDHVKLRSPDDSRLKDI